MKVNHNIYKSREHLVKRKEKANKVKEENKTFSEILKKEIKKKKNKKKARHP